MTKKTQFRLVLEVCFQTWDGAVAAADELRAAGYEVVIADDIVDLHSNAAFAEVYMTVDPAPTWRDFAASLASSYRCDPQAEPERGCKSGTTFGGLLIRLMATPSAARRWMTPTCRLRAIGAPSRTNRHDRSDRVAASPVMFASAGLP